MGVGPAAAFVAGASDAPEAPPRIEGHLEGEQILAPLLTPAVPAVTDQLRLAASLTRTTEATLHVLKPVRTPEQSSMAFGPEITDEEERDLLEWAVRHTPESETGGSAGFFSTRSFVNGILHATRRNDIDTLVLPNGSDAGILRRGLTDRLALHAACDVVTVNGRRGYDGVPSILLAVAGGPHSGLAADVAGRVASDCGAWIDIVHVVDETAPANQQRRAEALVEATFQRIGRADTTTTWVLEAADVAEAIIEQSAYYGLTVVGAPTKGRLRQFIAGSTNRTIRNDARSVVLSVRSNS